jgi:hypothetical protein
MDLARLATFSAKSETSRLTPAVSGSLVGIALHHMGLLSNNAKADVSKCLRACLPRFCVSLFVSSMNEK